MSLSTILRWTINIILFFVLKDYLRNAARTVKWIVWTLFGATIAVDLYFAYWYHFVLGRVPNDWLTAYFGGIILCILAVKVLFTTIRLVEIGFKALMQLKHKKQTHHHNR